MGYLKESSTWRLIHQDSISGPLVWSPRTIQLSYMLRGFNDSMMGVNEAWGHLNVFYLTFNLIISKKKIPKRTWRHGENCWYSSAWTRLLPMYSGFKTSRLDSYRELLARWLSTETGFFSRVLSPLFQSLQNQRLIFRNFTCFQQVVQHCVSQNGSNN